MKFTGTLTIFVLAFLAVATSAYAQSPREELQQMVEQLQKTPYDTALREKIITFATSIKPAPAIPEEARRSFIIGEALFKQAKNLKPAYEAANAFWTAATLAPWWGNAYWNLAVAQQLAGQYASAKESLRLYLLTNPSPADRRTAQDRLYAIEADIIAAKANVQGGIAGFWQRSSYNSTGEWFNDSPDSVWGPVYEIQQTGSAYSIKCTTCIPEERQTSLISADMNAIHFRIKESTNTDTVNYKCKLNGNQLSCMSIYSDGTRQEERYLKRGSCEIVGGPGIRGYIVLCK